MSVHCMFCGHQANWRDDGEVSIDNNTWVVLNILRDPLLGEKSKVKGKRKRSRPLEQFWGHRDCAQSWLENLGCETKLNYKPKRLGENDVHE
jgi:hypothetical protein